MAYAAVISLIHTIERLINPTNPVIAESAYEELQSLRYTLKRSDDRNYISIDRVVINALDAEIRDAVWKLEDVLESYVLSVPASQGLGDENGVEQEIDSILKTVKKLRIRYSSNLDDPVPRKLEDEVVWRLHDFVEKKTPTVGSSDQIGKIVRELLDGKLGLKTVSLVGMAGIGKTHLATEIYQHPIVVQEFDFRAWVSVGQKDKIKNVLADIVGQIYGEPIDQFMKWSMLKLKQLLQTSLYGRRYLIVLDDMWSTKVYNTLIRWLPASGQERRLLLTTRLQAVARYYCTNIHPICFLDIEESWDLLRQNVFVHEPFPRQLEEVGRKIAENCEGLPLLILAVAEILRGHNKTEAFWEKVANKKTSTFPDAYDRIEKVLSSSYNHLPQHLKVCFLYMGVFSQSCEIPLSKFINLCAVEDFLEPKRFQTFHDFATECMEKLVSCSLVLVCKHSSSFSIKSCSFRIKSCKLHSAYWHLCVKEARKNKFFHVLNKLTDASKHNVENPRRLSVQNPILFGIKEVVASLMSRSLLCTGLYHEYPVPICFDFMLLKLLDALAIRFYDFPAEVVNLKQLRYLALTHNGIVPCSISNLKQLQCLIVRRHHNIKLLRDSTRLPHGICDVQEVSISKWLRDSTCLPKEIWDVQELRHLRIMGGNLPDPSDGTKLPNLSTLHVNAHSCTKAVFSSVPNVKKIGIEVELQPDAVETLSCFEHIYLALELIQSLKCVVVNPRTLVAPPIGPLILPEHLKKLSLNGLGYPWMYMSEIGSLQHLEVLKLRCSAFQGPEWKTNGREFQRLRFLLLEDIDLVRWKTKGNCFRRLQRLTIRHCYKLRKIPSKLGGIPSLRTMEVIDCSPSLVASAQQMHEDEDSSVQVVIISSWKLR